MDAFKKLVNQKAQAILLIGQYNEDFFKKIFQIPAADFKVVTGEVIKIEQSRELIRWLNLKPLFGQDKIAVIEQAEKMTTEAANALLKTIEEPPPYANIILITLNERRILPTIKSRCQKLRIPLELSNDLPEDYLSPAQINPMDIKSRFDWVKSVIEKENPDLSAILTAWQSYFRQKLLQGKDVIKILAEINQAKDLLETNISVKLLLENIVLNF